MRKYVDRRYFVALILLSVVMVFLLGCPGSPAWRNSRINSTEAEARRNNENMMKLELGQSREEVLQIMEMPTRREVYQLENQRRIEFLFYRTAGWSVYDLQDRDYQFTPLAFEDSKLVGWGRNYYDRVVRASVELKIKE